MLAQLDGVYCGPHYGLAPRVFEAVGAPLGETGEKGQVYYLSLAQLSNLFATNQVIIGHYPAWALIEAGADEVLGMIREPRSRIISEYRYHQSRTDGDLEGWGDHGAVVREISQMTFAQFLRSQYLDEANAGTIVNWLLAPPDASALRDRGDEIWETNLPYIKRIYWPTEIVELFDAVANETGNSTIASPTVENVTPRSRTPLMLTKEDRALLDQSVATDLAAIKKLVASGHLSPRSRAELDQQFAETLTAHNVAING